MLKFDYKNTGVTVDSMAASLDKVQAAYNTLVNKTGAGNDFLGWLKWPVEYDKEEFARVLECAKKIREDSEVLVVIGIGGSYLGAKAVIEAMKPYFKTEKDVEIIFAGHTLSSTYASQLLKYLENKEFSINVISKSGTTTEPAVAFRLFKELLIKKYGNEEAEEAKLIIELRGLLSPQEADVVILKIVYDFKFKEIAEDINKDLSICDVNDI